MNEKTLSDAMADAGNRLIAPIDDIVVGDYVLVQTGDKVPADGILVDGTIRDASTVAALGLLRLKGLL